MPIAIHELSKRLQTLAQRHDVISYGEVAKWLDLDMGLDRDRRRIGDILGEVSEREAAEGRPLLSATVVSADRRVPGKGFFQLAKRLGLQPAGVDDDAFYFAELKRVHDYWSQAHARTA